MEDKKGQFTVIAAGYPEEMNDFMAMGGEAAGRVRDEIMEEHPVARECVVFGPDHIKGIPIRIEGCNVVKVTCEE